MIEKVIAGYLLGAFLLGLIVAFAVVRSQGRQGLYNIKLQHTYQTIGTVNSLVAAVLCVLVLLD